MDRFCAGLGGVVGYAAEALSRTVSVAALRWRTPIIDIDEIIVPDGVGYCVPVGIPADPVGSGQGEPDSGIVAGAAHVTLCDTSTLGHIGC